MLINITLVVANGSIANGDGGFEGQIPSLILDEKYDFNGQDVIFHTIHHWCHDNGFLVYVTILDRFLIMCVKK